mmetsp:Transcript_29167/g.90222  ORF Transcript_29167/g.90222 Transcript_29167/m.90222 type:complete len:123 (-) Transcript_29167:107-475(-)
MGKNPQNYVFPLDTTSTWQAQYEAMGRLDVPALRNPAGMSAATFVLPLAVSAGKGRKPDKKRGRGSRDYEKAAKKAARCELLDDSPEAEAPAEAPAAAPAPPATRARIAGETAAGFAELPGL